MAWRCWSAETLRLLRPQFFGSDLFANGLKLRLLPFNAHPHHLIYAGAEMLTIFCPTGF
jgi:hypothetical protein